MDVVLPTTDYHDVSTSMDVAKTDHYDVSVSMDVKVIEYQGPQRIRDDGNARKNR
jgi:hypothetical protein